MNTLILEPTDVLFFRDGRPMGGSLSGHGASWPLPSATHAALHAALWRAGEAFQHVHTHRRGQCGKYENSKRDRKFGSLITAGPFPLKDELWLFPKPLDAGIQKIGDEPGHESFTPTLLPLRINLNGKKCTPQQVSSLPAPLLYPVANKYSPAKNLTSNWWNVDAWQTYLGTARGGVHAAAFNDTDFADTEHSFGIGMDPARGTQDSERFYSAHFLRLRKKCAIGVLATAKDKDFRDSSGNTDLISALFTESQDTQILFLGGEQRVCTVRRMRHNKLPLPIGMSGNFQKTKFPQENELHLVKWVLLSPAIFPKFEHHSGGWLPSWVDSTGKVQLLDGPGANHVRRHSGGRVGKQIRARLVAALVGKPVLVAGYAAPHETTGDPGGIKTTRCAVPAGSVYYFACESQDDANKLASALNWHGAGDFQNIRNRRSALFGEKGFGLGVCGTWDFHDGVIPI